MWEAPETSSGALDDHLVGRALRSGVLAPERLISARRAQTAQERYSPLAVLLAERGDLPFATIERWLDEDAPALRGRIPRFDELLGGWRLARLALEEGGASGAAVAAAVRRLAAWGGPRATPDPPPTVPPPGAAAAVDSPNAPTVLRSVRDAPAPEPAQDPTLPAHRLGTDATSRAADLPPATARPAGAGPARSGATAGFPRPFGRYHLQSVLGRGGMGIVYRAFDPVLRRDVAVKTLAGEENGIPEALDRFVREARAAAALEHPGIVAVHDVGVVDGVSYLAMTYVPGKTLDAALRSGGLPTLRERARVVRDVAHAVAHAHAHGIVHRDLKPANILVDECGRPRVTDFGLARNLASDTRITQEGRPMGTPAYMSPEQIQGEWERVGPTTDVYALGVVLYEMLAGSPPYRAARASQLLAMVLVLEPDPPRKRNPRVPPDLETICLKAMSKEPPRRYPTAAELAADLDRWLAGEAILARPEGAWERVLRRLRRHRALALVTAALCVVLGAAFAVGWRAEAWRRETVASLRTLVRTNLQAALLLRRAGGDLQEARHVLLAPVEEAARKAVETSPDLAEPHVLLGRMYRAFLFEAEARVEQERALAKDATIAEAWYEHGTLLLRELDAALERARRRWARGEGERLAAGRAVEAGGALPTDAELVAGDAALRSILDRVVQDYSQAERVAAARGDPELAEVAGLLGRCYAATGLEGEAEVRARLERITARKDLVEDACRALAWLALRAGDEEAALLAYSRGLETERGSQACLQGRASLRRRHAIREELAGRDPDSSYECAEVDCSQAVSLYAHAARSWLERALVRSDRAFSRMGRGADPAEALAGAEADFGRALQLAPQLAEAWLDRGKMRLIGCLWREDRGEDPTPQFPPALADLDMAISLDPDSAEAWRMRGLLRSNRGLSQALRGNDPTDLWAQGEPDFARAIALDPYAADSWRLRGLLRTNRALYGPGPGGDPLRILDESDADLGRAIDLDPRNAEAWLNRGHERTTRGLAMLERGRDGLPVYQAAEADLTRALELAPGLCQAWIKRGLLRSNIANVQAARGEDPLALQDQAVADLDRALEIDPRSADARMWRAVVRANRSSHFASLGRDTDADTAAAAAAADYRAVLAIRPDLADAWMKLGTLEYNRGRDRERRGELPDECYRSSESACTEAVRLNPRLTEARLRRASTRSSWGSALEARGDERAFATLRAAEEDFTRALDMEPGCAETWWRRAYHRAQRRRFTEAIDDFEEAAKRNPAERSIYAQALAECRVGLAEEPPGWIGLVRRGRLAVDAGDYASAQRWLEEGLAVLGARPVAESDRVRLMYAEYDVACALAVAGTGRKGPSFDPEPIAPDAAAALRDRALAHLRAAVERGWNDAEHLRADPDFESLRADPRWRLLLEDLMRGR